jgi:CBS domain containing-hemolysin-like protein
VFSGDRTNIVGMLLVKNLLSHNTDERMKVKDLKLSPLPRFLSDHSLFSVMHEFKLGKSHLGVVESIIDGQQVPIGIITFEDLIEELLQQEIIDETDEVN